MNNQVKLTDTQKLLDWITVNEKEYYDTKDVFSALESAIKSGVLAHDTPPVPTIKPGDSVYHNGFKAQGKVKKLSASGKRAYVVWFDGCVPSYVSLDSLEVVE
ncbi:hypothetical protein J28TS4_04900 [Paenibacillus lautus]|uniref:hypothetical protein n=1 Tax=Paenibacillus lautus TaxID=1401 RepID=UPI001B01DEFC|nr:hypothetical protein [Paenibacillus lautus]GIP02083.1 hypothetical protein J28TS4_04900 [Paenibacillus lautus]